MISVHSNNKWINRHAPKLFKIRCLDNLTDHSRGTVAALNWYQNQFPSQSIGSLIDRYEHVIVYLCEPFESLPMFSQFPNVTFFTDILMDEYAPNHCYIGNWFMTHDNFYQTACWAPDLIRQLNNDIHHRTYRFDALLGVQRPHRDFIYQAWQSSPNRDQVLMTYHGSDARRGIWHVPYEPSRTNLSDAENQEMLQITLWTNMPAPDGSLKHRVGTQHLVPTKIYNDSWYSIIAEGFLDDRGTRLTEKTAKALVAKRLFVYFGAPNDLARMRRLGFETFDNVIDESYDTIPDNDARWHAAWQQVEWLCTQNTHDVLSATQSRREHNQRVFFHTDWHANLTQHLREICTK